MRSYVDTIDASFPSSIILAVDARDTDYQSDDGILLLKNDRNVAKVLDGQHRIAGLEGYLGQSFELIVTIFVDMDIEDQAMVFATINLEQTKVNRSLAYDLFAYARRRSPQKTGHNIVRLLDSREGSPFRGKIKILGVAGDRGETLSQALFIDSLMPMISHDPRKDRDILRRGKDKPSRASPVEEQTLIFRNMFLDERDAEITRVLWNYFGAVENRWGPYWREVQTGNVLNRTTGFRGLMQFLRFAYLAVAKPGEVPTKEQFNGIFAHVRIEGDEINPENYPPGTSGQTRLRDHLLAQTGLE